MKSYQLAVVLLVTVMLVGAEFQVIKKRDVYEAHRPKRPFCNAFTGCGRKRSDNSIKTRIQDEQLEEMGRYFRMLENLIRQNQASRILPQGEPGEALYSMLNPESRRRRSSEVDFVSEEREFRK